MAWCRAPMQVMHRQQDGERNSGAAESSENHKRQPAALHVSILFRTQADANSAKDRPATKGHSGVDSPGTVNSSPKVTEEKNLPRPTTVLSIAKPVARNSGSSTALPNADRTPSVAA